MIYDLQKGSIWKRISAFLFDLILLATVAALFAILFSWVFGYDGYSDKLAAKYEEYGVDRDFTQSDFNNATEEEQNAYMAAVERLEADEQAQNYFSTLLYMTIAIITVSILISYILLEFVVPLLFKNGQTLGKKIFGIALMRKNGVRVNGPVVFTRTVIGKYAVETMIPVYLIILLFFNQALDIFQLLLLVLIPLVNLGFFLFTPNRTALHDLIADTVAVDFQQQMIFESEEAMVEYKARMHREAVENDREKFRER